jgi:hypothetical protein
MRRKYPWRSAVRQITRDADAPFVQIGEIKTAVFGDIGETLRFIPNDFHGL